MVVKTQVSAFLEIQAFYTREPAGTKQQERWRAEARPAMIDDKMVVKTQVRTFLKIH